MSLSDEGGYGGDQRGSEPGQTRTSFPTAAATSTARGAGPSRPVEPQPGHRRRRRRPADRGHRVRQPQRGRRHRRHGLQRRPQGRGTPSPPPPPAPSPSPARTAASPPASPRPNRAPSPRRRIMRWRWARADMFKPTDRHAIVHAVYAPAKADGCRASSTRPTPTASSRSSAWTRRQRAQGMTFVSRTIPSAPRSSKLQGDTANARSGARVCSVLAGTDSTDPGDRATGSPCTSS